MLLVAHGFCNNISSPGALNQLRLVIIAVSWLPLKQNTEKGP